MLTSAEHDIIKATIPLLEAGGEALTAYFYRTMISNYPEVRPLFNQAHQANGTQPRALANAVLMYARNIERMENLGPLAGQIIAKHVALQILPEHYPIVGGCLLQAIRDVLGAEIATDEVIGAWAAAYQQLADILMEGERNVYDSIAQTHGGWRGARAFKVIRKVAESSEIISFYLAPVDGKPVISHKPGQYIGLRLLVDGQEIRRNYSLSAFANGSTYRISVKRENGGIGSNHLHKKVKEGSVIDLYPPSGNFTLTESDKPLVLISGGVGITPMITMAQAALERGSRLVIFVHYARNSTVQAFKSQLQEWQTNYPQFKAHVVHAQESVSEDYIPDTVGYPAEEHLRAWLPNDHDVDVYFLGPKPFMAFVKRSLRELGIPAEQTHYEFFGPAEELV